MRILIVHHGTLPAPGRAVTGGALRAWHHGRALQAAGHEVFFLTRAQDTPGGYDNSRDLVWRARHLAPDRIVCVQLEEAAPLGTLGVPMAVDLYAPRLLESPFEGHLAEAAVDCLRALAAGSVFLVSNPRQRWAWLSVLALAGVDIRTDPTRHVPLISPIGPARRSPETPLFVAGGASWPWQDPLPSLERVLDHLDRRGEGSVLWFGGAPLIGQGEHVEHAWTLPEHPRLLTPGWLPYDALLERYAAATAALDWMAPNPERALALSFRHVDYLGCGLPILTGPDSALADVLGEAGWATDDIEGALDAVLDDPEGLEVRSQAARGLAASRFSLEPAEAPLLAWVEAGTHHRRARGPLVDAAQHAAEAAEARSRAVALEAACEASEQEVDRKRQENQALTVQIQQLTGITERLTRTLDEVAGFKREAVAVLGGEASRARRSLEDAEREVSILRADLAKKSAELLAMDQLRARLENDLVNLREALEREKQRGVLDRLRSR
ncbi:MAG: hypothetical protein ACI8S6_003374 [Myxococcota bacterium]|jgi:hypothetical protein